MAYQPQNRQYQHDRQERLDTTNIQLKNIKSSLFDTAAKEAAIVIADNRNTNKPSQLRKFYDEIVMWESKISQYPIDQQAGKFTEFEPYIKMINAKVAYALGRKLVDENYVKLVNDSLKQIDDYATMRNFKLFMEAFMGFYKEKRPKD